MATIDAAREEALRIGKPELAPPTRLADCDEERVQSALGQPRATFNGADLYPDVLSKAAALLYFVAKGHVCPDGNKRTGFILMNAFLELNGLELGGDEVARAELISAVAASPSDQQKGAQAIVRQWLQHATSPLSPETSSEEAT